MMFSWHTRWLSYHRGRRCNNALPFHPPRNITTDDILGSLPPDSTD